MSSKTVEERKAELAARRARPVNSEPATDSEEAPLNSILRKAKNIGKPSTLVVGSAGSGKSTLVRNMVLEAGLNPLWLALNNDAALQDERVADWDVAVPADWAQFVKGIYKPAMSGELSGYSALVIDGGNVLTAYSLSNQVGGGKTAEQRDWQLASNDVRDYLVKLREKFSRLYMTVDIVMDKNGARKIDLNPYTKNILLPLFGNKMYTHVAKERGADNKLTGKVIYSVQRNPALALEFTPGENITFDAQKQEVPGVFPKFNLDTPAE